MICIQRPILSLLVFALVLPTATASLAGNPVEEMALAAERLLNSMEEKQREKAVYAMSDEQRQNWHFLPDKFIKPDGGRYGLPMTEMSDDQRALTYALVSTGLSHKGFLTTMTVTSLEQVLHVLENNSPIRNPALYYVTIFGKPGDPQAWGWRFEGHHLSINFTIVQGKLVSVTPVFFGANPAEVLQGTRKGLKALGDEEKYGRKLVMSLTEEQKKSAIIADTAPKDIITGEDRKVDASVFMPAKGVAYSDLNEKQQNILLRLVKVYAEKFRPEIVKQIHQRTKLFDLAEVRFAWAGSLEPGEGHYYRVQTPKFLFEYDNTQNDANHVHAVWRDFDGDFGADLLRSHYDVHHAK